MTTVATDAHGVPITNPTQIAGLCDADANRFLSHSGLELRAGITIRTSKEKNQ